MVTKMLTLPRLVITTSAMAACSLSTLSPDQAPGPGNDFTSQGIVTGLVRDTEGRGVANAVVCATAVFTVSGTPGVVVAQASTNADGAYLVPVNLTFKADVRARLTVAATPARNSGLEPGYTPGLTVLITTTLPPAETTYANVALGKGPPNHGIVCVSGP